MLIAATGAWAYVEVEVDGLRYRVETGSNPVTAQVIAPSEGVYTGEITIPSSINYNGEDITVDFIRSDAFKNATITKVTIPSTVYFIGGQAFYHCENLTEITLPEGLQEISSSAFSGCPFTTLTIPGTVTKIGSYGLEGLSSLQKLTFEYSENKLSMDWSVFNGTNNITELVIDRDYTYGNQKSICQNTVKKVTLGQHVTRVPEYACCRMSLDELTISPNVTTVGNNAFMYCSFPEGFTFPFAQIKTLESGAFHLCSSLPADLDLTGVESIGESAFRNSNVQTVKLSNSLTTLDKYVFSNCDNLTAINIPSSINSFTANTFQYCNALTNVTFDYSSTALTLEDGTFSKATNLTIDRTISGTAPFSTTKVTKVAIGSHMATSSAISGLNLSQYTGLTEIELLEGWTEVPYQAFKDLATVTTLTLPEGLEKIEQSAFEATGLTAITIPGTMKIIGTYAFKNCPNLTSLTLDYSENLTDGDWMFGKGVLLFNGTPFYQTNITDFVANRPFKTGGTSTPFTALKRATFGPHVTTIVERMFAGLTLEQLTVSENITEVGNYAFTNCILPDGVVIPFSNLKKIGNDAFRGCTGLPATIDLSAIEEISSNAFQNCTSIESLTIGGGTIGSSAFSGCTNLASITLNEGVTGIGSSNFSNLANLTTISLPSTLKTIGPDAFANCANLTIPGGLPIGLEVIDTRAFSGCKKLVVTIPSMVKTIGQSAFSGCESLTEVTIPAGVTGLGMYTFSSCTGLTSVTIPGTLKTMSRQEFAYCSNLTTVTIENGAETLKMASDVFYSTPCTNLIIDRPFEWTSTSNNQYFKNAENVTFGEHVTAIPDKGLYGSQNLNTLTMTDNVTSIGEQAFCVTSFSDTSTKELKLSKNLQTIGKQAFQYMYNGPEALVLPITVTEIGQQALASHYTYPNTLKDIYVPWIDAPLALTNDTESYGTFRYADNQTLWVPGGTMASYQAADGWKRFQKFDYWSFVVNATVAGKGTLAIANGEAVTDNGTNTAKSVTGIQLVEAGAGTPVSGLFVREKDLTLTATPARGYELNTLTANGADIKTAQDVNTITNLLADQNIAAEFTPIIYTITYNNLLNGVLPDGYPTTYTVEDNDIILPQPTRTAYNFTGWTGTDLTEPTMTVTIPAGSIENREFTATWEPIVYPITYDLAGGAVATADPATYTIETADFTLTNPTKLGYTFTGWEGTDLTEKTMPLTVTTGNWGDRSYTATWEPNPYKVRFDINGGDGTETMADQDHVYDSELALTTNAFTRTGYTFKEWNSKADGTGIVYTDGQSVLNLTAVRDDVVTMYAQWTPIVYNITYDLVGGTIATANPATYTIETPAFTLNNPTKAHWVFTGWEGTDLTEKTMSVTVAPGHWGERSYTATWEREIYTVSIQSGLDDMVTASTTSPKYEDDVVVTIADNEDYELVSFTVDGVEHKGDLDSEGRYTIANVDANVNVVVTFNAIKAFIHMDHIQQTFSSTQPLDFTDTDLKAYIANGYNNGTVLMTRVYKVPANTGLLIVGTPGQDYKVPFKPNNAFYGNLLKPVTEAQVVPQTSGASGEYTNFLYGEKDGVKGFYKSSGSGLVAAGKAYLQLPTAAVASMVKGINFIFDEETGIEGVKSAVEPEGVYDMNGRKLGDSFDAKKMPRGVYIVNGKKVVIK